MSTSSSDSEDSDIQLLTERLRASHALLGGLSLPLSPSSANEFDFSTGLTEFHAFQQLLRMRMHMLQRCLQTFANDLRSAINPSAINMAQMFLPSENESESAMLEKRLEKWGLITSPEGRGQFIQSFITEINKFLNEHFQRMVKNPQCIPVHSSTTFADNDTLQLIFSVLKSPSMQSLVTNINGLFLNVVEQSQNYCSVEKFAPPDEENESYVSDFSSITEDKLNLLVHLFSKSSNLQSKSESLNSLKQYVPTKPKQKLCPPVQCIQCAQCSSPTSTESSICLCCGKTFCVDCPMRKGKLPSQKSFQLVSLCTKCHNESGKNEADGWREKRKQLLNGESEEDIQAGIACFLMELYTSKYSDSEAINCVNKLAKQFIELHLPQLSLPLLCAIVSQSEVPTEKIRAHILISKALELMAYDPNTLPQEQLFLLRVAKAECEAASKVIAVGTEIPDLSTRISSLEKTVSIIESEDQRQLRRAIQLAHSKLQNAWIMGEWEDIFQLISDTASDHLKRVDGKNPTLQAIKEFVKTNSTDQNKKMLHFLEGVVNIFDGNMSDGLANIEVAVWSGRETTSNKFYSTVIDLVIGVLLHQPENVLPLQKLQGSLEAVATGGCLDHTAILASIRLEEEDLFPPFKLHWPQSGLLTTNIRSYEDFGAQKVAKGDWTCTKAAENYLDMIEKCSHPSEIAVCFLNASLWLLKMLKLKSSESPLSSEIYALKMAVFHYITQAFIIAQSLLHTGMQFYVARVAVAATLLATKFANQQATSSDAAQLVQFLYTFLHVARFCPFWKVPIISASEATTLNDMLDTQHCVFVSKLKHIPDEFCHLEKYELLYRLYENDFTGLQKQENPKDLKQQTMQELLQKKGLTWENVSFLMKTSLCKRTPEGWICNQQPVGTNLEFSEIKGLRVHLNTTPVTMELLVIQSNGTNGLVSTSDMDTFLTIEPNELRPLYFSLDPPSRDEKYHPFQELRFHPKALQNTEVLETLLDADYLMKFFSVGSEVSANPPFDQRPNVEGLLSKLPAHLREALKSVPEYGNAKSSLYRFWIEANEMKYDVEQFGSVVTIKCDSPEMIIRKHRMYYDPNGKMCDTEEDDDPNSAESKFAAAMTEHYDEIGKYFPAYARLKELCKVQLLTIFIKNIVTQMTNSAKVEVTDIETMAKINVTARTASRPILPCWWVPASMAVSETMICYGGVNLAPTYMKCTLPVLPTNTTAVRIKNASTGHPQRYSHRTLRPTTSPQSHSASSRTQQTRNASSSTRHHQGARPASHRRERHGQQLPQTAPKSASAPQPPVVVISSKGCQELPITKALHSSPLSHATYKPNSMFGRLPRAVRHMLGLLFPSSSTSSQQAQRVSGPQRSNGRRAESRTGNAAGSKAAAGSEGGSGGGSGGRHNGSGGGSGEQGGGGGRGPPSFVLAGVMGALVISKILTSELRHVYAQRKFRKTQGCTDPNLHAAHILSLEVVVYAVHEGRLKGTITMSQEKIVNCLKEAMNINENFQLVERIVNLRDHRRHDRAIINKDKLYLRENPERTSLIREFFTNHFASRIPLEMTKALLSFFEERGIISSTAARKIEKESEAKLQNACSYKQTVELGYKV